MSFRRHDFYVASGVAWLGEMPSHWHTRRLKFLFNLVKRTPKHEDGIVTAFRDGEVTLRRNRRVEGFTNAIHEVGYQGIRPGDLVIHAMDAFAGAIGVSDSFGKSTPVYSVCTPIDPDINPRYYAALLRHMALSGYVTALAKGIRERSTEFRWADASEVVLPVPSRDEQRCIVSFLDRETAKIDALVEEQRRLIELLKEKRQAVISQAVTKGLDQQVKLRESGVDWLGFVPAHWSVASIKHIVSTPVTDGPHETPNFPDEGIPFVSAEAVSSGVLDFEKKRGYISVEDHQRYSMKYRPRRGDIYMVKSGATTGVTAIVETDQDFNIWSPLAVVRCDASCDPYFILNFMRSKNFQEAVTLNWSFGTQQNIGMGVIENLAVPVPPLSEQRRIAAQLSRITSRLDALIKEADGAIQLLQERRGAIISTAVTGKIDVRGLVPQPEEAVA